MINPKRYGLYLLRWQASTPILAVVTVALVAYGEWIGAIVANLIGGLIFFWVDKFIFTNPMLNGEWQVKEDVSCIDCGKIARGYRLVRAKGYDRTDAKPEFRCEACSQRKSLELRKEGIKI
jgi:DNA-directed RNA polymerase subunit RPC12/RpoP